MEPSSLGINVSEKPGRSMALTTTTREWIPVSDIDERELVIRLVREDRSFIKRFSRGLLIPDQRSQTHS